MPKIPKKTKSSSVLKFSFTETLSPRSSKITETKKKERRKRKSEEKKGGEEKKVMVRLHS